MQTIYIHSGEMLSVHARGATISIQLQFIVHITKKKNNNVRKFAFNWHIKNENQYGI